MAALFSSNVLRVFEINASLIVYRYIIKLGLGMYVCKVV